MGGLESFLGNAQTYVQTNPWLAFAAVFVGGALTASSPCVLAMIPLVIGFVGGYDQVSGWRRSAGFSLVFVFGLAVSFTAMGLIAISLGRLFGDVGGFWPWIIAAVCLAMAAHLWNLWTFSVPERLARYRPKHAGIIGAFTLGLLFGLVSAPCAAPILVVILTYIAAKGNVIYGLARNGVAPRALVNAHTETIVATGAILAGIPTVDGIDIEEISTGDILVIDAEAGTVEKE